MAGSIRTSPTTRENLHGLAIHLIWSFGTYTDSPGLKKSPNVVYATNIAKKFSEHLEAHTLRKQKLVNSFNVENDNKVIRLTTHVWKMQNIQQEFVLHVFKSDDELRNKLS